jgi:predicted lipid-binding transport protein (Tim44 family)
MQDPYRQPQSGGGFMRSLGGGILGGLLGGMLFRGLGFAGNGGYGSGIGLIEIVLFAALLYFGYVWFVRRRRVAEGAYSQASGTTDAAAYAPRPQAPSMSAPGGSDAQQGLDHIRQMDVSFDEKRFTETATDLFFKIQGAWTSRDIAGISDLLTGQMFQIIGEDIDRLKADKKFNRLENIAVRDVNLAEAWQESGSDFAMVKFSANLLDYTVDEATGQVVSGSKTDPVKFEEYWTFTRPVGNHPWRLSAIEQAA